MNTFEERLFVVSEFILGMITISNAAVSGLINSEIQFIIMHFNINKNKLSDAILLGARGKVSSPRLFSSQLKHVGSLRCHIKLHGCHHLLFDPLMFRGLFLGDCRLSLFFFSLYSIHCT